MVENRDFPQEKIKLWTRQHSGILKDLEEHGVYRVKKEYIQMKMDTISGYFFHIYDWYTQKAQNIVEKPEGAEYPIWFSTSPEIMLQPIENTVVLELEVERKLAIITDMEKWGYVSNFWYLPLNKEDEKKFNEELKKYGISDESSLYMSSKGNFYPLLKSKIIKSWERLFDNSYSLSNISQATLWEIRKDWIVKQLK
jgi:hypothetical protein